MVFVAYIIFLIWLGQRLSKKETIVDICICSVILLPSIKGMEAANFVFIIAIFLAIVILLRKQRVVINRRIIDYVFAYSILVLLQLVVWLIKNPYNLSLEFRTSFAVIRYPLIILALSIYEFAIGSRFDLCILIRSIEIINLFNLGACIIQKIMNVRALAYFGNWYSYSQVHILEIQRNGKYYRTYGTWDSPMSLGIYALLSIAILLYIINIKKIGKRFIVDLIVCIILGILSLTKSFFLGSIVIIMYELMIYMVRQLKRVRVSVQTMGRMVLVFSSLAVLIVGFQMVYEWSELEWTHLHYYLGYVLHPFSAFESRLSATGSLSDTIAIIKKNLLIGVGSVPVAGELIGDNVYIVLLHAGGITALLIFLRLYSSWLYECFWKHQCELALVITVYLLSGCALPVGWTYKVCILPCVVYLLFGGEDYEKNYNDGKTFRCRRS